MGTIRPAFIIAVALLAMGTACSQARPVATPAPPVPQAASSKPDWQAEWEKTVAEGKREGSIVMYTNAGTEVKNALTGALKEKYGIGIEWVSGRGAELTTKILGERRAGLYFADLWLGGATTPVSVLKPQNVLAPVKPLFLLPEVLDARAYYDEEIPFVDREKMYIMVTGPMSPRPFSSIPTWCDRVK